jgi:hypothetical protein
VVILIGMCCFLLFNCFIIYGFDCVEASQWLLSDYLSFFSCGLIFPVLLWFYMFSSFGYRITCRIFCSGDLVVIYCFSFCFLERLIPLSILNDSFAGCSILRLKLFSFRTQNSSLLALLAFKISVEKSAVILMDLPLYFVFSLSWPSIFFLCSVYLLF